MTNIGLDYPNQIAPLKKLNPHAAAHNYFNASAFASDLSCGYEVCGVTGTAKQYLFHGPGAINTDAGVEKDTKITERMQLNLRLEMFNVFNHANFTSVAGDANQRPIWSGYQYRTRLASARSAASSFSKPTQMNLSGMRAIASLSVLCFLMNVEVANRLGDFNYSR